LSITQGFVARWSDRPDKLIFSLQYGKINIKAIDRAAWLQHHRRCLGKSLTWTCACVWLYPSLLPQVTLRQADTEGGKKNPFFSERRGEWKGTSQWLWFSKGTAKICYISKTVLGTKNSKGAGEILANP